MARFLCGTTLLYAVSYFSLIILPLAKLDFAREDIRIMTDETSENPPTKENIVSIPCEMLFLPLHLIELREMRMLVHDAQPDDTFFFYCAWS
jgi:hypothetical protein